MIPKSNLDDRNFTDIVDEAIRLIPRYCPEWTNHNTSDPGITLIELFAWMTEMTLYRLNKVPEKTYLSLLELMGLSLIAPQAARAVVCFYPVEGYKKDVIIKKGTQIAALNGNDSTYIFETEKTVVVNGSKLVSCINRFGESWNDACVDGQVSSFSVFEASDSVEHAIYVSSPLFSYLVADHSIQMSFDPIQEITSVREEVVNYLYWEYWNGREWSHVEVLRSIPGRKKKDNIIYFTGPLDIEKCEVNGIEDLYLRGVLSEVPDNRVALSARSLSLRAHFSGSGFMPDMCLTNSENSYSSVDMNSSFRMFSEFPSYNECFYVSADEVFSNVGLKVRVSYFFSEIYVPGDENENALFAYEYWDGASWARLGDHDGLRDGTFGFKQEGEVSFIVPATIKPVLVNNEEHIWIRVRLITRDLSIGGEYVRDEKENWVWRFTTKVHSPVMSKIRITYESKDTFPQRTLAYSDFRWMSLDGLCHKMDEQINEIALFEVGGESAPSLYLGFTAAFPKGESSLYFYVDENSTSQAGRPRYSFFSEEAFAETKHRRLIDIGWEYWDGNGWEGLSVNDYTDSFHESGFVEFTVPSKQYSKKEFGKELYWIRARLLSGSFESRPKILSITLNSVYARNVTTYKGEILGSGTGAPGQYFMPAHNPILPGCILSVNEGSIPPANELESMKSDGIIDPYIAEGDSIWVRYKEVDNFYSSGPFSRHYVVDYQEGKIYFGDGQRGVNPPRIKFNIRLDSYSVGGGSAGNVAAHTLKILTKSIPFISGCNNPFPAEGGADMESVENLKSRAAGAFKSLQRAVTVEDFEWLARESSSSVGRAYCLKNRNLRGEITVIVIPVMFPGSSFTDRLFPSRELLRRVKEYLEDRKLVGTKINVQGPLYRTFDLTVTLVIKSDVLDSERLKKEIESSLRGHFHPLVGNQGSGWEFGKMITSGPVFKQLERIEGVLSVDAVEILDVDAGVSVEKVVLKDDEIPFLREVLLENRKEQT